MFDELASCGRLVYMGEQMVISKGHRGKAGFTIVELLISLALTGMILAAVASAFNASAISYRENESMYKTINMARQSLHRITCQLRCGYWVDLSAPSSECSFYTTDGEDISYVYRSDDQKLYLITNSDSNEYVLCENVTGVTFTKTANDDGSDAKSVQISMTVSDGNLSKTISSAAVIRKNL